MSKTRLYRLLEILDIFDRREGVWVNHEQPPEPLDVVEALRLVWCSIPDAFVSLQEMQEAYGFALNSTEISDVHTYYEEAIRQTVSCREPRTLSQYCKITVRKILHKNNQWLPDGITQLNLPPKLQDYLNLQM
ncbi:hypothetical protein AVEN_81933-1 [Araneus ventricosus]|uniref:SOCS box domain-containing protein n=1 Tax=Araneus ventricosus TaxID=182803 RepID=A0A4Y2SKS0_ARAVE|nr:hypothetical protein AVEN_81933-1 [Araneus ventricosus]